MSLGAHGSCYVIPPHQVNKFTSSLRLYVKSTKVAGFPVCISLEKDKSHRGADRAKRPKESNASRGTEMTNGLWMVSTLEITPWVCLLKGTHRMSSRI